MKVDMMIADESLFKRLLLLERRRAERTGTRFALMLVDMEELASPAQPGAMEEIGRAVGSTMRETDVTGWYRSSSVLGVILTTLNGAGRQTLESVVIERTRGILSRHSAAAGAEHIWISCHIFPDDEIPGRKPSEQRFSLDPDKKDGDEKRATLKRVVDVSGSVMALLLLSPVFLSIAALIKATSKGPGVLQAATDWPGWSGIYVSQISFHAREQRPGDPSGIRSKADQPRTDGMRWHL
jgi:hypothetical protein